MRLHVQLVLLRQLLVDGLLLRKLGICQLHLQVLAVQLRVCVCVCVGSIHVTVVSTSCTVCLYSVPAHCAYSVPVFSIYVDGKFHRLQCAYFLNS